MIAFILEFMLPLMQGDLFDHVALGEELSRLVDLVLALERDLLKFDVGELVLALKDRPWMDD